MYDGTTDRFQEIWSIVEREATQHSLDLSPELLLYALICDSGDMRSNSEGIALNVLKNLRCPIRKIQKKIIQYLFSDQINPHWSNLEAANWAEKPEERRLLENINEEAQKAQQLVSSHHILLTILHQKNSLAFQWLEEKGITLEKVEKEIEVLLEQLNGEYVIQEEANNLAGVAPWTFQVSPIWTYLLFPVRILSFFVFSIMLIAGSSTIGQQFSLVGLILTVFVCSLLLSFECWNVLALLEKIPFINLLTQPFKDFYNYYFQYKPRSFLFYSFYPILGPFALLSSKKSRKEFNIFMKIALFLSAFIVLDTFFQYNNIYPPYLNWKDALNVIYIQFAIILVLITFVIMPIISTCFTLSFFKQYISLFILFLLSLLSFTLCAKLFSVNIFQPKYPTSLASNRFEIRLTKPDFCKDLTSVAEGFLTQHISDDFSNAPTGVSAFKDLTLLFQQHCKKKLITDGIKGFRIIAIKINNAKGEEELWLGLSTSLNYVAFYRPLFLLSPKKKLYDSWKLIPDHIQKAFTIFGPAEIEAEFQAQIQQQAPEPRRFPHELRYPGLIKEYKTISEFGK